MLRTLENMIGYRLVAKDGEIGKVYDFFVDDTVWRLRYLVVETGNWLNRRRILIAPAALGSIDGARREFMVNLTRSQVESGPGIDTDRPVSRQQEMQMNVHYGWPAYWAPEAVVAVPTTLMEFSDDRPRTEGDPHLRSFREIGSYSVIFGGQPVGRAQDFVIEDSTWSLTQMVMQAGGWMGSRLVALPAGSITEISWARRSVTINLSKEALAALPAFDAAAPVNREEAVVYFDYYGRPVG